MSLIFGAVDFREANGRSEIERRPQADWWAQLLEGRRTIRVSPAGEDESFERWADWFRTAAGRRLLEFAQAVRKPVGEVVEWLLKDLEPGTNGGPIIEQFRTVYM